MKRRIAASRLFSAEMLPAGDTVRQYGAQQVQSRVYAHVAITPAPVDGGRDDHHVAP